MEDIKKKAKMRQEMKRLCEGTRATFEVLTAVMMKIAAFWDMITGRLVHSTDSWRSLLSPASGHSTPLGLLQ
jgi:hypothetical protein